jgi:hypothetical protein
MRHRLQFATASLWLAATLVVLAGCASTPAPPAWQGDAHAALQAAVAATLAGDARIAEAEAARVRQAIGATGQPDLLARAELVLCAARVAGLDLAGCPGFEAVAVDAEPAERAYAAYLYGQVPAPHVPLLPAQHQAIAAGGGGAAALTDPLARLIGTAVLLRQARLAPADVAAAVQTASAQGWRRPLLAWLGVQLRAAEAAGDAQEASRIRRQMALAVSPR